MKIPPVSGRYEKKDFEEKIDTFELKVDVDQVKEFSPVLNVISGTIGNDKGNVLK